MRLPEQGRDQRESDSTGGGGDMEIETRESVGSVDDADRAMDALESLLQEHRIVVERGSKLEAACLAIRRLGDEYRALKEDTSRGVDWPGMEDDLRAGLGTLLVAELLLARRAHPDFSQLVPHLHLLNEGNPSAVSASSTRDDAHNKLLELLVALMAMKSGSDFTIDDPSSSAGGTNPDVLCRHVDGRVWGFACKMIGGTSPMTLFQNIAKGADQITKSRAEVGVVTLSFKNRLPHEKYLPTIAGTGVPTLGALKDEQKLFEANKAFISDAMNEMAQHVTLDEIHAELAKHPKVLPVLLIPVLVVIARRIDGRPMPTLVKTLHRFELAPTELSVGEEAVCKSILLGLEP